jgi:steroid delta-isomerase-like uncharacterized protein
MAPTLSHRKQILSRFLQQVWNEGDADAVDRYLAPLYTIHHDPGDSWHAQELDRDGFRHRLQVSRAPFPDQHFTMQDLLEDGDAIAVTWLWSATHRGDVAGFSASGKTIRMSGATIYYFDADDRLTGHWQISDRLGVYQQLSAPQNSV